MNGCEHCTNDLRTISFDPLEAVVNWWAGCFLQNFLGRRMIAFLTPKDPCEGLRKKSGSFRTTLVKNSHDNSAFVANSKVSGRFSGHVKDVLRARHETPANVPKILYPRIYCSVLRNVVRKNICKSLVLIRKKCAILPLAPINECTCSGIEKQCATIDDHPH